ncbi:tyrosine-type recombinase/integrase [Streptomyces noursei]|uniref:tyrosine-type recombinase/integrase n=1 Tax=Streptomyces noursei TaxID=1971 RepID=UPI000C9CCC87|nr:tyrosine-type recombinase/integrase [Streptomyces noursei]
METSAMLYDANEAEDARSSYPGRGTRNDRTVSLMPADQYERLLNNEDIPTEHRAVWALLRDRHTRVTEALSLNVRDVDLGQGTARFDHPKLSTDPKVVPISDRAVELLRQAKGDREAGPLITGARGRPLSHETVSRVARQAGATSIHAFRPGRTRPARRLAADRQPSGQTTAHDQHEDTANDAHQPS